MRFFWFFEICREVNLSKITSRSQSSSRLSTVVDANNNNNASRSNLNNINLELKRNNLVAIIGKIGSGKSTLLNALINECPLNNNNNNDDSFYINKNIVYAPQKSWIFSASVVDNILFGNKYNKEWFDKVVYSCGLINDFKQF